MGMSDNMYGVSQWSSGQDNVVLDDVVSLKCLEKSRVMGMRRKTPRNRTGAILSNGENELPIKVMLL